MRTTKLDLKPLKITALVLGVFFVLYALAGFLLAPWLAERYVPRILEEQLNRQVSVESIKVNPFLLTLQAKGGRVAEAHGSPVIEFEHALADFNLLGLLRGQWFVDEAKIDGLRVHLVVRPDGTLNVAELADHLQRANSKPQKESPLVEIEKLSVPSAHLLFTDLRGTPATLAISSINLQASGLSAHADKTGTHQLSAALPEGGSLEWNGELALRPSVAAKGEIKLHGLHASTLMPFLRDQLKLSRVQAVAEISGHYTYSNAQSLRLASLEVILADVLLARTDADPLLAMERISVTGVSVDLAQRRAAASALTLQEGQLTVTQSPDGTVNWERLFVNPNMDTVAAAEPEEYAQQQDSLAKGWSMDAASLTLEQVAFRYADRQPDRPLAIQAAEIAATLRLSLTTGATTRVVADRVQARLRAVTARPPGANQATITLASSQIRNGTFDLGQKRLSAQEVIVEGGNTSVVRQAGGRIVLLDLLGLSAAAAPGERAAPEGSPTGTPWRYDIAALRVRRFDVALADHSIKPAIVYGLQFQQFTARNLANTNSRTSPFSAAASLLQGGTLRVNGSAALSTASVKAHVEADQLGLLPLQPLVQRFAALTLKSGVLSASGDICYQCEKSDDGKAGSLVANGKLQVSQLLLNEAGSGDRFLSWKRLDADGIAFALGRKTLAVKQVTVTEPSAKIAISEDRTVNLTQVIRRDDDATGEAGALKERRTAAATGSPPLDVRVERVRFENGKVDYADLSLVLPFSTTVTSLNGTVVGLSTNEALRAEVQAVGEIQPYGSAKVEGSLVAAAPSKFTDLHVVFNNVLMPPLSPYTATFAGRKVESGKLWLDLDYKVSQGELLGKNDIRLADFTLGERVDAPSALNLPLDLAVALLTDSKGEINLSVPLRGDLDNPRFSVAAAAREMLGNVLQRLVTAPFRALGNLFDGANAEALAAIEFAPGSAALRPEQREKLDALSTALQELPRVELVVSAPYHPGSDARAIKQAQARRELAQALGRRLNPGEEPGPIAYDDPDARRALERMLREHAGAQALQELQEKHHAGAGGDRELYVDMFMQIVDSRDVDESTTRVLATERARTIASYLTESGLSRERIQTGRISAVPPEDNGAVSAKLQLAAGGPT